MVDPTKEIGQDVIDAIVTEWDERPADPARWAYSEGAGFTVRPLPSEASAIGARARREGKMRDGLIRELAYTYDLGIG